jgi:hypothetical protein
MPTMRHLGASDEGGEDKDSDLGRVLQLLSPPVCKPAQGWSRGALEGPSRVASRRVPGDPGPPHARAPTRGSPRTRCRGARIPV